MLIILKIRNDNIWLNSINLIFNIYKKDMYRKHSNAKGVLAFGKVSFNFLIVLIIFYKVILKNSAHIHCALVMKFMFSVSYYDIINHLNLSDIFHEKTDENYKYIILIFKGLVFFAFLFLMVFGLIIFCTILFVRRNYLHLM